MFKLSPSHVPPYPRGCGLHRFWLPRLRDEGQRRVHRHARADDPLKFRNHAGVRVQGFVRGQAFVYFVGGALFEGPRARFGPGIAVEASYTMPGR